MGIFIGREIDFNNEHKDFLRNSFVAKEMFAHVMADNMGNHEDSNGYLTFATPAIKGFLENIIKNDLPIQAVSKIDHQWLIDKNNSEDVREMFNKIYFPETQTFEIHKVQILEARTVFKNILIKANTWIFKQEYDCVDYLKEEFIRSYTQEKSKEMKPQK